MPHQEYAPPPRETQRVNPGYAPPSAGYPDYMPRDFRDTERSDDGFMPYDYARERYSSYEPQGYQDHPYPYPRPRPYNYYDYERTTRQRPNNPVNRH